MTTRAPIESTPHPSEHSRLLLALSSTAIVFGGGALLVVGSAGWAALAALVAFVLLFAGLVWVGLQVYRARLLGNCIRVGRESIPELHAILEDVRRRLDYHRRVDVCVVQKANPSAQLTSYLGTKVIVLEGALVGDLLDGEDRSQLTFLLARYIGALKARHQRLTIVFVVLEAVSSLGVLFPFLLPYYRATTYSGDQLGQACCGELDAALGATERLLVGREVAPEVRAGGVVRQAALVRRRVLPRLAQLAQHEPHLTNRYVNLLFWTRRSQPDAWEAFCASTDPGADPELARLWARSPHSRRAPSRPRQRAASTVVAAMTALALFGIGLIALPSSQDELAYGQTGGVPTVPTPEATATAAPPTDGGSDAAALTARVPSSFRDTCEATSPGAALAAVECTPWEYGTPDSVRYYQFADSTAMDADFDAYAADLTPRDCPDGQTSWETTASAGRVACFADAIGTNVVAWTDESLQILAYAETSLMEPSELHRWWLEDSGPN